MKTYTARSVNGQVFIKADDGALIAIHQGDKILSDMTLISSDGAQLGLDSEGQWVQADIKGEVVLHTLPLVPVKSSEDVEIDDAENEVIEPGYHHSAAAVVELDNLDVAVKGSGYLSVFNEQTNLGAAHATESTDSTDVQNAAVITNPSTPFDVTEDTHISATITLSITDADGVNEAKFKAGNLRGAHGSATITEAGVLVYTLANNLEQGLNEGESITDIIKVTSKDGTTHDVSVSIHGTNDLPTINAITAQSTTEDGIQVSGQLTVTDVDTGDSATYATTSTQAGFTLKADGSYTLDPTDPSFQHLGVGETQVVTIPIVATDSHSGVSSAQNIVITITGTNDAPVVSAPVTLLAGTEDKTQIITAAQMMANATDADTVSTLTIQKVSVDHGTVTTDSSGSVHFTPEVNYSGKVTFSYEITDSHGATVLTTATTDLAGVQDAAVITSTAVDVTDGNKTSATITLGITDADAGEANFKVGRLNGGYGTATLAADGAFVYTLNHNAAQHLNVNETITDVITVTSADGTTHDVSVSIHGTNDLPTINAITAQSAKEGGSQVSGQLSVTDVDTGDTATYATTSTQAGFTLKADGSYTLDPTDASFQHLAAGETQKITIPVTATDSHAGISGLQNIVITITGTNDIPVVSAPIVLAAGTEDITQTITTAQLIANTTDVDSTSVLSIQKVTVDHGTVTTDSSGAVHFTPEADYNGKVIFSYEVTDSNGGVVATTATTDLAAVADNIVDSGARDLGSTKEDTAMHFTEAQLLEHLSDADGALHVVAGSLSTAHGAITGDASHGYDFTPSANYNGKDVDVSYKVTDGTTEYTKTAQIDVTPVTDTATPSLQMTAEQEVMSFGTADKNSYAKVSGINGGTDLHEMSAEITFVLDKSHAQSDSAALLNYSVPNQINMITFHKASDLTFTFMGDHDIKTGVNLLDGGVHRLSLSWNSATGHLSVYDNGHSIKELDNVHKGDTFAGGGDFIVGTRTGDSGRDAAHFENKYSAGGRIFSATIVDHAVSATDIKAGPIASEPHGVLANIMTDGKGAIIDTTGLHTVSSGTNSHIVTVPVDASTALIPSGGILNLNIDAIMPVGTGDKISAINVIGFIKGTVLDDGNGHKHTVTDPNEKVDVQSWSHTQVTAHLPAGITKNMHITVEAVTTGTNGVSASAVTGEDLLLDPHAPIMNASITGDDDKTTDESAAVGGVLKVHDQDASQAHFDIHDVKGQYGVIKITADGHWTFTPNAVANALNSGDTVKEAFTVKSADGTPHDITIHVTGSNDAPLISSAVTLGAGTEDTALTFTAAQLLSNASDADAKDSLSIKGSVSANHGSVTGPDASGNYTFTPDANYHGAVKFTYDITDTHGAVVHTSASTNLANVVDTPTLTTTAATGDEDTAIALAINASTQAGDHISQYTITGLPTGAKLTAGHDNGHGSWTVASGDIATLKMTPPANYAGNIQLHVVATATDGASTVDSTSQVMSVHVNPIADMPSIDSVSVNAVSGMTGVPITQLDYAVTLTQDMVSALNTEPRHPPKMHMSALDVVGVGVNVQDIASVTFNGNSVDMFDSTLGLYHIVADKILGFGRRGSSPFATEFHVGDKIEVVFKNGVNPTTQMHIVTGMQEGDFQHRDGVNGLPENAFAPVNRWAGTDVDFIKITQTASKAQLSVDEDGQFDLAIGVSTPDKDGSEVLEVHVQGLPTGATLNQGARQTDGSYLLTKAQLHGLQVLLPKNYHGSVDLDVSVTSHDGTSTLTSPANHLHIGMHSVLDLANVYGGQATINEHDDWTAFGLTANATDTQDPITGIQVFGLSAKSEIRLEPSFSGTAPVYNADGTWTIDPASVGHLQIHTTATAGNHESYKVAVTTTDPDGTSGTTQAGGIFISKAVIEGHFDINTAHTGIVSNIGELVTYSPSTDADEIAYVIVEVKPGITLVDDAGNPLTSNLITNRVGGNVENYKIAVADLAHAHVHSTLGATGLDIHLEAHIEEGVMGSGTNDVKTISHDFTGLSITPISHADDVTLVLDDGSDSGANIHDDITNIKEPNVAGLTSTPLSHVEIYEGTTLIATTTSDSSGFYSVKVPALSDGAHTLTAQATAPGATHSVNSSPLNVAIDTQITAKVNGLDHVSGNPDEVNIQLFVEKGSEITHFQVIDEKGNYVDISPIATDISDASHSSDHQYMRFPHVDVSSLSDGELHVVFEATDAAGNSVTANSQSSLPFLKGIVVVHDEAVSDSDVVNIQLDADSYDALPSLDHIADHLTAKQTEHGAAATPEHNALLATAATLLGDTQEEGDNSRIIKAVQSHQPLGHAANHDALASDKTHDHATANADVSSTDYALDIHSHVSQDDDNDGTGLT